MAQKAKLEKVGALWKKKSEKGNTFCTGNVTVGDTTISLFMFANDKKDKDGNINPKFPDYNLYLAPDRDDAPSSKPAQVNKPASKPTVARKSAPVVEDDDDPAF